MDDPLFANMKEHVKHKLIHENYTMENLSIELTKLFPNKTGLRYVYVWYVFPIWALSHRLITHVITDTQHLVGYQLVNDSYSQNQFRSKRE